MNFFYSFTETALHSLWQSALLVLMYAGVNVFVKRMHPLQKRNFLYFLLATQIIVSAFTFIHYFTGTSLTELVSITGILSLNTPVFSFVSDYADVLFYVYAVIVSYRFFAVWQQRAVFKNECTYHLHKPSAALKVFTELRACQLGIKRKVTLRYSSIIAVPFTYGFFKPFILLPFSLVNNLTLQETESIILHELTHIKGRDYLLNWFLIVTDILYFFNPFIKILTSEIKAEREKNCDVQVINFNGDHLAYAETLLKIARLSNNIKAFQMAAVRKTPELMQRINFFSDKKNLVFNKCHLVLQATCIFLFMAGIFFLLPTRKQDRVQLSPAALSPLPERSYFPAATEKNNFTENHVKVFVAEEIAATRPATAIDATEEDFPETAGDFEINPDALFASFNELPDSTKELIYNEETQQGRMTQSFKLILVKGEWIIQPQWMMLENKPDSTRRIIADTLPPVQ